MAKLRKDYIEDLKWSVKDLYNSDAEFNDKINELIAKLPTIKKYKGHLLDNATTLYEALKFDTEFNKDLEQVYIYAHIQNDQDTTNTYYQELFGKAYKLYQTYCEETSFIVPELLKQKYDVITNFLAEEPKLKEYERVLKDIYKLKKHILSAKEEKLISSISSVFKTSDEVYSSLSDADMVFGKITNDLGEEEELTEKSYRRFIESSNREVRKEAFTRLLNTYGNFKNTYASLLASEVNKNNRLAKVKKYKSALSASLFRNDIPERIYTNLINSVQKNIKPLSKFWALKREMLGVEELHIYDTFAPITKEIRHEYTIQEAQELLNKSLSVLGSDYLKNLSLAFSEKWIDFCPNDGKRNGAYCTACYNVHPYVLLSFDGTLNNVSTLAHELGHAMHYYYAIKNQSYNDYGYSIFVAEVASQVNQILLSKYLIANTTSKDEKSYLIDDLISDFKSTIYRQTMFAEFERTIHELEASGEILTHELLCDTYYKLNKAYFGENIIVDECIKYEWERIPHFYMNFYVYQYATAYAAAIKIASDILNNKENAVSNYLEFLSLGCTKTPIESLKIAGVDMEDAKTLDAAFAYFDDLVTELIKLKEI